MTSTPERLQRRGDEDETKQKLQYFSGCRPGERSAHRRTNKAFKPHRQADVQQCGAAGKQSHPAIAEQAHAHRRNRDEQHGASGRANVGTENEYQRRNEQLAAGDAEEGAGRADAQTESDTGDNLPAGFGGHERNRLCASRRGLRLRKWPVHARRRCAALSS
jgi:hypothetical protein